MTRPLALVLAAGLSSLVGGEAHRRTEKGNELYRKGQNEPALQEYQKAQAVLPEAAQLHYDIGNVLYRKEDWAGAAKEYESALGAAGPDLSSRAAYNLGNALFHDEKFDDAVKAYTRALKTAPRDGDAKHNLELALRALEQKKQQPKQQQQQKPDQRKKDEQKKPAEGGEQQKKDDQKKNGGPKPEDQPKDQGKKNESKPGGMTPEEAQKLLDRMSDQEKQNVKREQARLPKDEKPPGEGLVTRVLLASFAALAATVSVTAAADDVHVNASVLPDGRISETSEVRLVIRIDGSSIPDVATPKLPALKNLRVVGGPQTARNSSYTFENGRIASSSSLTLTYFLAPSGAGQAEIPPFDVVVGGSAYRTQPLRFNVEPGRSGPAPPQTPRGAPADDTADDQGGGEAVDVFLQTKLGASSVWSGQPVLLDVTLFAAAPVNGFTWTDVPSLPGLWAEDIQVDPGRDRHVVTMNGRQYVAYPVARKLVVPTGSGPLTIQPFAAQVQVRRAVRDPFASFFSLGGFVNLVRHTSPVKLDVKPLPEAGRPADFSGAVGAFRMKVVADRTAVDLGDGVAVRVTVEGDGSLQSATPPKLTAPPDVKVYDPKALEAAALGADHLGARKTWEWVVVPLAPGTVKVPPPTFAYFDPVSGSYKQLRERSPT